LPVRNLIEIPRHSALRSFLTLLPTLLMNDSLIAQFRALGIELVLPSHHNYHQARRVWNHLIDRQPIGIAVVASTAQVADTIRLCTAHDIAFTVRGGGHNVAGFSVQDGALLLDLSRMRHVHVDRQQRFIDVEGGALWCDIDMATEPHDLVAPGGLISHTGALGLALGGGLGWLSRSFGLTCDNIIEAEVVLHDASIVVASNDDDNNNDDDDGESHTTVPLDTINGNDASGNHSDLLWALRGGGGNFGVVTRLRLRVHELPCAKSIKVTDVYVYDRHKQLEALQIYSQLCIDPRLADSIAMFAFMLSELLLIVIVDVSVPSTLPAHDHDHDHDDKQLNVEQHFERVADFKRTDHMPVSQLNSRFDQGNRHGEYYYWSRSSMLHHLPTELLQCALDHIQGRERSSIEIMHLGGKVASLLPALSPMCHRHCMWEMHAIASWSAEQHQHHDMHANATQWIHAFNRIVQPYSSTSYLNTDNHLIACDSSSEVHCDAQSMQLARLTRVYGVNTERLRAIKAKYDPHNRFRFNHNIPPATQQS
jgi:FAD/FMN-containing dehydrogenase